jgi:hypothetical protein
MAKEVEPIGEHGYHSREIFFGVADSSTASTIDPRLARRVQARTHTVARESAKRIVRANGNPPTPGRPQGRA